MEECTARADSLEKIGRASHIGRGNKRFRGSLELYVVCYQCSHAWACLCMYSYLTVKPRGSKEKPVTCVDGRAKKKNHSMWRSNHGCVTNVYLKYLHDQFPMRIRGNNSVKPKWVRRPLCCWRSNSWAAKGVSGLARVLDESFGDSAMLCHWT